MASGQIAPATAPTASAPSGVTAPHAGVMATRPAIAPDIPPSVVACPSRSFSTTSQARIAAQVALKVFSMTTEALLPAASAEPPLKPNQPNHRMPAPSATSGRLLGRACRGQPVRLPTTRMRASAPMPALMCTAVPPAKSTAASWLAIQPPVTLPSAESNANTQWATGK